MPAAATPAVFTNRLALLQLYVLTFLMSSQQQAAHRRLIAPHFQPDNGLLLYRPQHNHVVVAKQCPVVRIHRPRIVAHDRRDAVVAAVNP